MLLAYEDNGKKQKDLLDLMQETGIQLQELQDEIVKWLENNP